MPTRPPSPQRVRQALASCNHTLRQLRRLEAGALATTRGVRDGYFSYLDANIRRLEARRATIIALLGRSAPCPKLSPAG